MRRTRALICAFFLAVLAYGSALTLAAGGRGVQATAAPGNFPDGPHRDLVVKLCTDCHPVVRLTRMRESRAKWSAVVEQMIKEGVDVRDQDFDKVVTYLSVVLGKKVRINEASAEVIAETFDIDEKLAAAIVKHRTAKGPFKSWKDIASVPGVDAARIEEQKGNLEFDGPSALR